MVSFHLFVQLSVCPIATAEEQLLVSLWVAASRHSAANAGSAMFAASGCG